ncbi:MAG: penicillin-binding protein 1B [Gammaproteobacteria bacterium]
MPRKKKASRKKRPSRKSTRKSYLKRWIWQLLVIGVCVFLSYCVWLDYQIKKEFEGKRWSIPARVYAQPTELYIGRHYDQNKLVTKLKELGYKPVRMLQGPGQYGVNNDLVNFYLRDFSYWDGNEESKKISVRFTQQYVASITDLDTGKKLQIIRLEPVLIGKIFPLHDEDRVLVHLNDVPETLVDALIAIEDRNFYQHHGIDPKGILRSLFVNIVSGKIAQGGSTLTQQLVKNLFLTRERTYTRKINEMLMALMLDYHYSKESILAAYVNEIFLGQHGARAIHGFGTAAEFYFSRPLNELNLEQVALLVGMIKGPSYYNPRRHPERARQRRDLVLDAMLELDYISAAQHERSAKRSLRISDKPSWSSAKYPAFLDLVRRHLRRDYENTDLRNEGLKIHTTLDTEMQDTVERSVQVSLQRLDSLANFKPDTLETAVVIASQNDGEVMALLGDRDRNQNAFNRALDAKRPIGSLIKPAIYLTALESPGKYHVLSALDDSPVSLVQDNGRTWTPRNYDNLTRGKVPLLRSLAKSYNLSTVRLGLDVGLERVIKTLRNLGISGDIPRVPALLLGALDLSPYEVTQMYQTIASGGLQVPLKTVRAVFDSEGQPLKKYDLQVREYLKPEDAFLTQYLLTQVVEQGTAARLKRELPSLMPLAGKTGTTNDLRDTWFAGFGDRLLGVVWVGRDDNSPTKLTGSTGAMQVWLGIMKQLKPVPLMLLPPENIEWQSLPDLSNPPGSCSQRANYPFVKGTAPRTVNCF